MSDDSAAGTAKQRAKNDEIIEDAVVIDEAPGNPEVVEVTDEGAPSHTEPAAETAVETAVEPEPSQRVVYVQVPTAPKKLGNRGVGSLIAVIASVVFTVILAVITAVVGAVGGRPVSFAFLGRADFYIPTLFFLIALVLLVLIVNRANWWTFIVGSLIVGVVVYFGTIGLGLLSNGVVLMTPEEASVHFRESLSSPFIIIAALLAREVALWTGGIISRRGRRLRARNVENRSAYDRELATSRAEHERATAAASATY